MIDWQAMWQDLKRWAGKAWDNFADDWFENLVVLMVGAALGRFGFPWLV